jgi:hypothetical protein
MDFVCACAPFWQKLASQLKILLRDTPDVAHTSHGNTTSCLSEHNPCTQLVTAAVAAKTKAEEEGVEEDEDEVGGADEDDDIIAEAEAAPGGVCARGARVQRLRLRRGEWRARAVVAAAGGEQADETLVANALGYEGG